MLGSATGLEVCTYGFFGYDISGTHTLDSQEPSSRPAPVDDIDDDCEESSSEVIDNGSEGQAEGQAVQNQRHQSTYMPFQRELWSCANSAYPACYHADEKIPVESMENSETTTSSAKVTAVDAASQRSQETKEALLRWQREQFTQRAELAKMQALAQDTSHPNEVMGVATVIATTADALSYMPRYVQSTWLDRSLDLIGIYQYPWARTLIDYVFVRAKDADNIAKGCLPVTTFPIADWRLDGRDRVLIASLAATWKVRAGQKPKPAYDREAMQADYRRDPMLTEVSHTFQSLMQGRCQDAEEISTCLLQACCQVYPVAQAPPQADRMQLVRGPIATMWATWREMRAVRGSTLRSIILSWKLRVRFKAQKRIVDRASREPRKLRVNALLDQAEVDDRNHNARGLYTTVRKLEPKQRYKPLQVKTEKGVCLSSREEVAELKKFFGGVFCDAAQVVVGSCDVPFFPQLEAMTRALKQLPAHKAVPHTCAPSIAWKACADTLAPYLHSAFEAMCCKPVPEVSHQWKDGWMVLKPKAGKPLCRACDVRPLALQDPGGKAAIRTVKEAIQPYVDEDMKSIPQYAYLQNRDGQIAILRAREHLRESFTLTPARGIRDLAAMDIAVADLDLYADDYLHQVRDAVGETRTEDMGINGMNAMSDQEMGRGQGGQQQRRPKRATPPSDQSMEEQEEGIMELLRATARLAIRLEDQQSLDRLDKAFLLHQRTQVPECMLEEMFKISETWKEAKASVPPKVTTSLCVILFKSYMSEFQSRLQKIEHVEVTQGLIEQGWLFKQGEELMWRYLAWDTTAQKDIQHPTLEPQSHATILQAVQTLLELASDQTLHRYHATRPLANTFTGPSVCFMLEVSLRGAHAQKMYQALSYLAQCAAMKLMGANLVRERINRSPLATRIHKMLEQ
ncbi:unnamed protein product [Symbiodinium microadriaticum]|nr:unnamed protein product [Symbiodinium sp. KB8]CAE7206827.1 unnamed protein product [Symbiodinium microadriaticum]